MERRRRGLLDGLTAEILAALEDAAPLTARALPDIRRAERLRQAGQDLVALAAAMEVIGRLDAEPELPGAES